jgi:hypothetical protein
MKKILSYIIIFTAFTLSITSCNKESVSNVNDSNLTGNFLQLEWVEAGSGTTVNSGLQYFGGSTILYPSDHTSDTATYTVTLNGPNALSTDLKVSLVPDWTLLNVNYANDSTVYERMPDSLYKFLDTAVTIKAGSRTATAKVVFFPSKINTKKNYMVPLTVTNSSKILVSKNFGQLYFHTIGNPIAGKYIWDFERRNNQLGTGAPAGGSFTGEEITFVPVTTKQIHVPTGYYVQPNYLISFKNTNGVLSDFTAEIEPSEVVGAFTNNGITIVSKPAITAQVLTGGKYKFTIKYVVFNGSAYRNCIDFYTQQ